MSSSGATVIVAYPRTPTATFNATYYLNTHMPMVKSTWTKHGLKSYAVSKLNDDGPYTYAVVMEFESYEGFQAAVQDPKTKEVMDDVKEFSSEHPVLVHGGVIGRG
jgi:uncharacterized protein (TIGR02118 family)